LSEVQRLNRHQAASINTSFLWSAHGKVRMREVRRARSTPRTKYAAHEVRHARSSSRTKYAALK